MKYLEKAFQFLFKNYLLLVPLFIVAAVPALIAGIGSMSLMGNVYQLTRVLQNPEYIANDPLAFIQIVGPTAAKMFGLVGAGGFLGFILNFIAYPATCGMINKGLDRGQTDLNDFSPSLSNTFVKYLLFWLASIAVGLILGVVAMLLITIFIALISALEGVGVLITVIGILAMVVAGIAIGVLLTLWFPAMVVDNLGAIEGLKRSIEIAKSNFWMLLGIGLLVGIAAAIIGGIVGMIVAFIPVLGSILAQVIPTFTSVLLLVFYFMVYRDKTGKTNMESTPEIENTMI